MKAAMKGVSPTKNEESKSESAHRERQTRHAAPDTMLTNVTYRKSNTLITAKGKSTLLGQKLFAIGILMAKEIEDGSLVAEIPGTYLRKAMGRYNGSFYDQIVSLVEPQKNRASLLDWRIIYKDKDEQKIEASNVITDVTFKDGMLTLRYNSKIKKYITGLRNNYTVLNLSETLTFTSIYTYRLYEMFKSEMDYQRAITGSEGPYVITYNIVDLKLMLGIINPQENAEIAKALKKDNPDYERIEEKAKATGQTKMSNYTDFRRYALERGRKELNAKSSIHMEYEPVRMGRGGKVVSIRFTLSRKDKDPAAKAAKQIKDKVEAYKKMAAETSSIQGEVVGKGASSVHTANASSPITAMDPADVFVMIDEVLDAAPGELSARDAGAILEAADYDMEAIRHACMLASRRKDIDNLVGWLISAVREGYTDVPVSGYEKHTKRSVKTAGRRYGSGSAATRNSFNDFEQNTYDYDSLEEELEK